MEHFVNLPFGQQPPPQTPDATVVFDTLVAGANAAIANGQKLDAIAAGVNTVFDVLKSINQELARQRNEPVPVPMADGDVPWPRKMDQAPVRERISDHAHQQPLTTFVLSGAIGAFSGCMAGLLAILVNNMNNA